MCARPIGMDLMEYYLLLKMIMIQRRSGEDGLRLFLNQIRGVEH